MKRDEVFQTNTSRSCDFEFNKEVAEVFDDMLLRSVPFYHEQQYMLKEIGKKFWIPGTKVYDLGCSTATTLVNLCGALDKSARLIGYDNSYPMLDQAQLIRREAFLGAGDGLPTASKSDTLTLMNRSPGYRWKMPAWLQCAGRFSLFAPYSAIT